MQNPPPGLTDEGFLMADRRDLATGSKPLLQIACIAKIAIVSQYANLKLAKMAAFTAERTKKTVLR